MADLASLGLEVDSRSLSKAGGELDRFSSKAQDAQRATGQLSQATGATNQVMRSFSKSVGIVGAAVAGAFGAQQMVQEARDFGAAIAEVSTLIEGTPAQIEELRKSSLELTASFGGSATQQVQAYYQAISAGASDVAEATTVLDTANRLAIGGITDVTTGVDALTTAVNAYRSDGLSAAEASDALFVGMAAGKTTIGELANSLGQVVPIASSAGVSFDELVAGVSALTKQGQSTAQATTGLRQTIASIISPTSEALKVSEALGLEFSTQALEAKGLAGFLEDVTAKTGGNQRAMAKLFGSVEALNAVLAFAGEAGGDLSAIMEDMATKAGATQAAYETVAQSMDQRLNVVFGQFNGLAVSVGQTLLTLLVPAMEGAGAVASFLVQNFESVQGIVIAAGAAITAAYIPSMVTAATSTAAWVASLVTLKGALIATGIGGLVVGAGLLVGEFLKLVKATGGFGEAFKLLGKIGAGVWQGLVDSARAVPVGLGAVWNEVKSGFVGMVADMAKRWGVFLWKLADTVEGIPAFKGFTQSLMNASDAAIDLNIELDATSAKLAASAEAGFKSVKKLTSEGFNVATEAAKELAETVISTGEAVETATTEVIEFGDGAGGAASKIKEATTAAEAFNKTMRDAVLTSAEFGQSQAQAVIGGVDGIANAWGNFVASGLSDFKGFRDAVLGSFKSMIAQMIATAAKNKILIGLGFAPQGLLGSLGQGNGGGFSGLISGLGTSFKSLGTLFTGGFKALGGFAKGLGAIAPAIGVIGFAVSALIGKTKVLDSGIQVTVNEFDTLVETFEKIEKVRLFGLLKSRKTKVNAADPEVADPIIDAVSTIQTGVMDMASILNIGAESFAGFNYDLELSLKDLSDEDKVRRVKEGLGDLGDAMASMVVPEEFIRNAEGATETLERLTSSLGAVNLAFDPLGFTQLEASLSGADIASSFVDQFGGIDAMQSATSTYFDTVYTEAQRMAILTRQTQDVLSDLGVRGVPETLGDVRRIVDGFAEIGDLDAAAAIIQLTPAIETLIGGISNGMDFVYSSFGNTQQQLEFYSMQAQAAFLNAGLVMPSTAEAFVVAAEAAASNVSRILSLVKTGEASLAELEQARAQQFALLDLVDEAKRVYDLQNEATDNATESARNFSSGVSSVSSALSDGVSSLESFRANIDGAVRKITGLSDSASKLGFEQSLSIARLAIATGEAFEDTFGDVVSSLSDIDASRFATRLDFDRARAATQRVLLEARDSVKTVQPGERPVSGQAFALATNERTRQVDQLIDLVNDLVDTTRRNGVASS